MEIQKLTSACNCVKIWTLLVKESTNCWIASSLTLSLLWLNLDEMVSRRAVTTYKQTQVKEMSCRDRYRVTNLHDKTVPKINDECEMEPLSDTELLVRGSVSHVFGPRRYDPPYKEEMDLGTQVVAPVSKLVPRAMIVEIWVNFLRSDSPLRTECMRTTVWCECLLRKTVKSLLNDPNRCDNSSGRLPFSTSSYEVDQSQWNDNNFGMKLVIPWSNCQEMWTLVVYMPYRMIQVSRIEGLSPSSRWVINPQLVKMHIPKIEDLRSPAISLHIHGSGAKS